LIDAFLEKKLWLKPWQLFSFFNNQYSSRGGCLCSFLLLIILGLHRWWYLKREHFEPKLSLPKLNLQVISFIPKTINIIQFRVRTNNFCPMVLRLLEDKQSTFTNTDLSLNKVHVVHELRSIQKWDNYIELLEVTTCDETFMYRQRG